MTMASLDVIAAIDYNGGCGCSGRNDCRGLSRAAAGTVAHRRGLRAVVHLGGPGLRLRPPRPGERVRHAGTRLLPSSFRSWRSRSPRRALRALQRVLAIPMPALILTHVLRDPRRGVSTALVRGPADRAVRAERRLGRHHHRRRGRPGRRGRFGARLPAGVALADDLEPVRRRRPDRGGLARR